MTLWYHRFYKILTQILKALQLNLGVLFSKVSPNHILLWKAVNYTKETCHVVEIAKVYNSFFCVSKQEVSLSYKKDYTFSPDING